MSREDNDIRYVRNEGGPTLGYSAKSGAGILYIDGLAFKDLNKDGQLNKYEDWRLSPEERAQDLAAQMFIEQIAGLMLYSSHQAIPGSLGWKPATYGGQAFGESGAKPYELSDQQRIFLSEDHIRHVLVTKVESPTTAARWNNVLQAYTESLSLGIPANNSSDPRHALDASTEFNAGVGGTISIWPEALGLAATFDPEWPASSGKSLRRNIAL